MTAQSTIESMKIYAKANDQSRPWFGMKRQDVFDMLAHIKALEERLAPKQFEPAERADEGKMAPFHFARGVEAQAYGERFEELKAQALEGRAVL